MKKNKLVLFSAILGMSLSMATGTIGAFAETVDNPDTEIVAPENVDETVPVILHKKQFGTSQESVANTGNLMPGFATAAGLNGVKFTAYNVTAEYYAELAKDGVTANDALAYVQTLEAPIRWEAAVTTNTFDGEDGIAKFDLSLDQQVGAAVTTNTFNGEDGIAKFDLPLYQQVGTEYKYAVYVFIEEAANNITTATLAVAFPVSNLEDVDEDGVGTVHLYPKNVIKEFRITVKKVATDTRAEDALDGTIFHVKKGDSYYKSFDESSRSVIWSDNSEDAKSFTISNGQVTIEGLTSDSDGGYTLVEIADVGIFEMTERSQNIPFDIDYKGDLLTIDDTESIWEDDNTVGKPTDIVDVNRRSSLNTITVENRTLVDMTIKKIEQGTGNAISGAEFKIAKESGSTDYLYKKINPAIGEYDYKWASEFTNDDTTGYEEVVLDGNTKKSVTGLLVGTYYVHEVTAPEGFILPEGEDAYTAVSLFEENEEGALVGIDFEVEIENLSKGALPSTGGSGIVIFLTMGSALMGGAIIMHRRNRKEAEEI